MSRSLFVFGKVGVRLDILLFILIILVASTLQASTGFGFSILATPFLLLLFQPAEAIQMNLLLSFIISVVLYTKIKQDIHLGMLKRLLIGSVIGLPFGMFLFLLLELSKLKLGISLIILSLTIMLIFNVRIKQTKWRDFIVGSLSGLLTTSIGMPGPPLLLYFAGAEAQKALVRGTTLAFYLVIYFLSVIIQVIFASTTKMTWVATGLALPLLLLGMVLGQLLFKRVSERHFQIGLYVLLLFTGVYLLLNSVHLL